MMTLLCASDQLSLETFMVSPRSTIGEALATQRRNGAGLVVVVAPDGSVMGTVSDDAIRRAVLGGHSLDGAVAEVMSSDPVVVPGGATDAEILDVLQTHRLRSVPLVDAAGRLLDVRSLAGVAEGQARPIAVIMAGGRGERLRPLTDKVPKPLLRVGANSIVERLIQGLGAASVGDVYVAVNYKADEFERRLGDGASLGVRLRYLREDHPLGTAGALSLLPTPPEGPVLVSNGDLVTTVDFSRLLDYHWHHRGAVTVAGVAHLSPIPYGVLETARHHLLSIEEKPHRRDLCSAGIYVLEPEVLRLIAPNAPKTMPELLGEVLAQGLPVHVFPILEKWFDIGGSAEFERVLVDFAISEDD